MSSAGDFLSDLTSAMSLGLVDDPAEKRQKEKEKLEYMASKSKPKPQTAPVADDEAVKRQSMRDMMRKRGTAGRVSTMLSDSGNLG
jgi:hypothetical protein